MGDTHYFLCHTCREVAELGYGPYAGDWSQPRLEQAHEGHDTEIAADAQGHIKREYINGEIPSDEWRMGEPVSWTQGDPYKRIGGMTVNWDEMSERAKDAWLAENLFDWDRVNESWYDSEGIEGTRMTSPDGVEVTAYGWGDECECDEFEDELPHYTTDISAAWQVVEHIHANIANVTTLECDSSIGRWTFSLAKGAIVGVGDTAPLAICHAAYLATRHHQMRGLAHEVADENAGAMHRLAEGD